MNPTFIKDTSDVVDFTMDFAAALQSDGIAAISVEVSNITLDSTLSTGHKIQVWLSGGKAAVLGSVKIQVSTEAGRTLERSFKVKVGEY